MISNAQIRLAVRKDLPQINDIYNWAILNTVATFDLKERSLEQGEEWFISHQSPVYPLYVVDNDGIVFGWGSLSPFHTKPAYRQTGEFSIYLSPEFQGKGAGNLLLQYLCKSAKELGYHTLIGLITSTNLVSLKLAEKNDFARVGYYHEVGQKFGRWLDVVVVQRFFDEMCES